MAANLKSKANQRKLRELAGVAYTRELTAELSKLERDFAQWRSGEIDPFEMSNRIHRFHDGVSRDLFVRYRDLPPDFAVARGIAFHFLQEGEIPSEILNDLEPIIRFCRDQARGNKPADKPSRVKESGK